MRGGSTSSDRSRRALLTGLGIDNVGSGLFLPLSLVYATRVVGLGLDTAGVVVAAATMLGFAVPPLAGRLSHRVGPRRVVVLAQVVQAVGALTYLVAHGPLGVFLAAGLLAAGTQLFYCSVFVLVADVSTETSKERPFAAVAQVRAAAFGLGNLVAAVVLATWGTAGLPWLIAVDAVTFVLSAGLLAAYVETGPLDHGVPATGVLTVLRDRRYLALMGSTCLVALATDVALLGVPVFVLDVLAGPAWLPGALLATSTALSSVLGVRVVVALRGVRRTRSLQAGAATFAVWAVLMAGLALLPAALLVPAAFAVTLVLVAGMKLFESIAGALSEALPPREARSGYMATYQYAFTTAQVLAPAVVALFAVAAWLPWGVVATAALAAVALLARLGRSVPAETNLPGRSGQAVASTR